MPTHTPYQAVIFDLLSALLNSWKLWNDVGMPVFWHNRLGLPQLDSSVSPKYVSDSLWPLVAAVRG